MPFLFDLITYLYCIMDGPKFVAIVVTLSAFAVLCVLFISYRCLGSRQPNQPVSHVESGSQWSLGPGGSSRDDVPLQGNTGTPLGSLSQNEETDLGLPQPARNIVNGLSQPLRPREPLRHTKVLIIASPSDVE